MNDVQLQIDTPTDVSSYAEGALSLYLSGCRVVCGFVSGRTFAHGSAFVYWLLSVDAALDARPGE